MTARELAHEIAGRLEGTCDSLTRYLDEHPEVNSDDLEDALLDESLERCQGCHWWFEPGELVGEDDEEMTGSGYCKDCRASEEKCDVKVTWTSRRGPDDA